MKLIDWIAVLGALAWLPQLLGYLREWLAKPRVRILTNPAPEVGFTTFGPILNLRMAFVVEHKDIVISGLGITVTHEGGSKQRFVWQGMVQNLGRLSGQQIGNLPFEKESNVLALKAKVTDVEERLVRFHDASFIEGKRGIQDRAATRLMYLKRQGGDVDWESFLRGDEMTDLYSFVKRALSWKQGHYTLEFDIQSPQDHVLTDNVYTFSLNQADVEQLEKNCDLVELDARHQAIPRKEGEPEVAWAWRYPQMSPRSPV